MFIKIKKILQKIQHRKKILKLNAPRIVILHSWYHSLNTKKFKLIKAKIKHL